MKEFFCSKWRKLQSSKWRFSMYALTAFIGVIIGNLLVNPHLYYILGALSGSLLIIVINLIYVIVSSNRNQNSKKD
ncbi:hypothetical protein SAMN05421734_10840 [Pelagirhabdus alkalitolerans]|uniref:Uncharacterized protein n=1 Tax=Pelagirhabdus alkalitolerans TaxID=1612202 RepID=A0A1G6LD50_9BACI|nr:hypothetical protein [Pelagirhabdus alkalitolerans]SDC41103.1 hypothetical protein SAMN05421734_10840 [Pelagirhabdus alkalitolerans]